MKKIKFGLTVFLSTVIPTNYLMTVLVGGMYGPFFKQYPPAFYISLSLAISLFVAFILVTIFINTSNLANRLPTQVPGANILALGGTVIILPQVLRIFTSMVEGGGASFALMSMAVPLVLVAKLVIYIGIVKFLMAVKPHESYVYQ